VRKTGGRRTVSAAVREDRGLQQRKSAPGPGLGPYGNPAGSRLRSSGPGALPAASPVRRPCAFLPGSRDFWNYKNCRFYRVPRDVSDASGAEEMRGGCEAVCTDRGAGTEPEKHQQRRGNDHAKGRIRGLSGAVYETAPEDPLEIRQADGGHSGGG